MSLHPPTPEEMSSSGSGTGLSPVAVNGASHTAASGELCQCNYTSTGAVAIQLPTGTVGVVDSGGAALSGSHPITVTAPAGYTFLSGGGSTFVIGLGATLPEFAADDCSATFVTNSTTMKVEVSAGLLVLGTMASQNAGAVAITGGTATGLTVDGVTPAQMDILANGAKSTIAVTMNAFGTWADGQTIVLPTIGSHTLKVTTTGDINIVGLGEAAAKAAIAAYLTAHAGATCAVTVVGTSATMTVTALAYGTTLNGSVVSGTMLAASGTMAAGANPISAAKEAALDALATQAANTITGNNTGAPAVAVGLTVAQIKTLLAYVAPDLSLDALKRGTAIADSSITIHPGTDKVSQYMANAGIFTTNRTTTVDGAGTPVAGHVVWLTRYDVSPNTWTIADSALGTIIVMPASTAMAVAIAWNGANWGSSPSSVQYLAA